MKYKTPTGEKITGKEFMSRWKKGIQGVTQLQQIQMTYKSTWVMVLGLSAGLIVSLIAFKSLWWLALILFAGLFNTLIVQIGSYQKITLLKSLEGGTLNDDKKTVCSRRKK